MRHRVPHISIPMLREYPGIGTRATFSVVSFSLLAALLEPIVINLRRPKVDSNFIQINALELFTLFGVVALQMLRLVTTSFTILIIDGFVLFESVMSRYSETLTFLLVVVHLP